MKTICITLNYNSSYDTLSQFDNKDYITIYNRPVTNIAIEDVESTIFLQVRESIELEIFLNIEIGTKNTPETSWIYESPNKKSQTLENTGHYKFVLIPGYNYSLKILGAFRGFLQFSDITQLETLDVTGNDAPEYCTMLIDAIDLIKLSEVNILKARYSLINACRLNQYVFEYFDNLKTLFLGPRRYDENIFKLKMRDNVIRQLEDLNIGVKMLPKNLTQLSSCRNLFIHDNPSWADLYNMREDECLPCENIRNIAISCQDKEKDYEAIINFYNYKIRYSHFPYQIQLPKRFQEANLKTKLKKPIFISEDKITWL